MDTKRTMISLRRQLSLPVLAGSLIFATVRAEGPVAPAKVWAELMGSWRMTGQAKRGSSQGAWTSSARAEWTGKDGRTLEFRIPDSTSFQVVKIQVDTKSGEAAAIELKMTDGSACSLKRQPENQADRYVFLETDTSRPQAYRMTLDRKSRDRWSGSLEVRKAGTVTWSRLQELGLTRQGTTIAQGSGQPVCVVTGGLGEIMVTVNGRSVYVCCSGCRETLLADPDAFLKPVVTKPESSGKPAGSKLP